MQSFVDHIDSNQFLESDNRQKIGNLRAILSNVLLSYWNYWRSLGDSNPCFRRERATSWAARRRELTPERFEISPIAWPRKQDRPRSDAEARRHRRSGSAAPTCGPTGAAAPFARFRRLTSC